MTLTLIAGAQPHGVAAELATPARQVVEWVDPLIGTGGSGGPPRYATLHPEYAGTSPLVSTPFGMTKWTPMTRQNRISIAPYAYEDDRISGFIGTHQPAIWMGDYGYVTLMPQIGYVNPAPEYRRMAFDHASERATPYGYSVRLGTGSQTIGVDMTATDHCGYLRFRFPAGVRRSVLVEATRPGVTGWVRFDPARGEIVGYNPNRMDAHLRVDSRHSEDQRQRLAPRPM